MKKKIRLDNNIRQIELFEKYYEVDKENKIIYIELRYDKVSEILKTNCGNPKKPEFSNEVLADISSLIEKVPINYKVEFGIEINDYEGYDPKTIIQTFNDTLELNQYSARVVRQRKELIASNLILVGVILLFIMVIVKNDQWFGDGISNDIVTEVINIAAWVFVWEAVTMLFLERSEQNILALKIKTKVSKIKMFKTGNNTPIAVEDNNFIFGNWENEGRLKRLGKLFFMISSYMFIFLTFYNVYKLCSNSFNITNYTYFTYYAICAAIMIIILLFYGVSGIIIYKNNKQTSYKYIIIFIISFLIFLFLYFLATILIEDDGLILTCVTMFIVSIFYTIGFIIDKHIKKIKN